MRIIVLLNLLAFILACKTTKGDTIKCNSEYAFSSNYEIEGDSEFLLNLVKSQIENGYLGNEPMIVIDAVPYVRCAEAKMITLPISKSEISDISVLESHEAVPIYGKQANGGLVLITSKEYEANKNKQKK